MKVQETKLTSKHQTTVPQNVREFLGVKAGGDVEWHVVRGMVVVDKHTKIKNPVKFLTSQIKLGLDAVKLTKQAREELT